MRLKQKPSQESFHHRHSRRRDAHQPCIRSRLFHRRSANRAGAFSMAWARTAPSARTRTPSRSLAKNTDNYAQGYFVYDSKKAGSVTVSHLRFGPHPIRSSYLISKANFVACHQFQFLERMDVLAAAEPGATFLLNSPFGPDEVWDHLPRSGAADDHREETEVFCHRRLYGRARNGHGQPHQHHHADLLLCHQRRAAARTKPLTRSRHAIQKTYGKRGEAVVQKNFAAVDHVARLICIEVHVPGIRSPARFDILPPVPAGAPEFVRDVLGAIIAGHGDYAARQRAAAGRDVSDRDGEMGKTQYRATNSGVGSKICAFNAENACWFARMP